MGFVSKTKRFSDTKTINDTFAPGPGSYTVQKPDTQFNRSGATNNFVTPKVFRDEVVVPDASKLDPGPGQYTPNSVQDSRRERPSAVSGSNFRSTSTRGFEPPKTGPAPGQYEVIHTVGNLLPGNRGGTHATLPNAGFRSTSSKISQELFYPEALGVHKLPGPGAYQTEASERATRLDLVSVAQQSSMFCNANKDRFGKSYVPRTVESSTPGPGWYGSEKDVPRAVASSSFFMSASKRGNANEQAAKPPGPAYYKPEPTWKRSFLLNATRKWV